MDTRTNSHKSFVRNQVIRDKAFRAGKNRSEPHTATAEGGDVLECIGATIVLLMVCMMLGAALT